MIKKLIILVILLSISIPTFAQSVDTAWVRRYDKSGYDFPLDITLDSSGNIYVTGHTFFDYSTIKYYPNGDTTWVREYNGSGNGLDIAHAVAVDGFGNVYVTGYSYDNVTFYDYTTIKYYENGDTAWIRRYHGLGNGEDFAYDIVVDDVSNVYVTGESWGSGTDYDYTTIKYNPNGDTSWVRRYSESGYRGDAAIALAVDSSGNVFVTGLSEGNGTGYDYATVKYYPNGDTAWVRRYNGPGNSGDLPCDIVVDDFSNVYVTGRSFGSGTFNDYATIKYDSNGNQLWVKRYNGSGNGSDGATSIALDGSGTVYVVGFSQGIGTSHDYATIKYYSNGDTAWVRRYNGSGNESDSALGLTVDGVGNVYVTGISYDSETSYDYTTIKYFSNGETAWVMRYNGSADWLDEAVNITLDYSGKVYVTGASAGTGDYGLNYDYTTIKYVQFLRGDTNEDGQVSLSDIVYLISYLFKQGPASEPIQCADTNCDGNVSLSDIVYLISYLFKQGPPPCI